MRAVFLICVCACAAVVGQDINAMKNMPKYDTRYDYLDVDAILDSKRLVKNYVECLVNSTRCSPEGKQLKRILPEALRTKCVRCTDRQKKTAVKVIKRLKYEYPEEWGKLSAKWDPTGDFTRYFEVVLAKDNFNGVLGTDTASSAFPQPVPTVPTVPPTPPTPAPTAPTPEPSPPTLPASSGLPPADGSTSARPVILNRFGDEDELVTGSPAMQPPTPRPAMPTMRPYLPPVMTSRPTPMTWDGAASDAMPTRFPLRPNMNPAYTTAITLIDQIGYKIMRTTELVTDILRNTVRAVVGR
ncbi:YLP motif-containing protein 1-like [Pectinophora gossypiella]|uniref:YLP motif-containing protein 1-like n=1 Tax=Pectinophora gossypiella TaxID=13191 RepID=UPI00214EDCE4|nr:YLP motif-containing protein 1-like [Pectinophora gossypiella]